MLVLNFNPTSSASRDSSPKPNKNIYSHTQKMIKYIGDIRGTVILMIGLHNTHSPS